MRPLPLPLSLLSVRPCSGVVELFVFLQMGGEREAMVVKPLDADAGLSLNQFDSAKAQCFLEEDREKLLAIVEASFGTFGPFNEIVRGYFAEKLTLEGLREAVGADADHLYGLFISWDTSGDGKLSKLEFHRGMHKAGLNASDETVDALFDTMDKDGSSFIEYGELKRLLHQCAPIVAPKQDTMGCGGSTGERSVTTVEPNKNHTSEVAPPPPQKHHYNSDVDNMRRTQVRSTSSRLSAQSSR
jgi:hypothetical protein